MSERMERQMAVPHDYGGQILAALGLVGEPVKHVTIDIRPNAAVTLTIERHAEKGELERVLKVLTRKEDFE